MTSYIQPRARRTKKSAPSSLTAPHRRCDREDSEAKTSRAFRGNVRLRQHERHNLVHNLVTLGSAGILIFLAFMLAGCQREVANNRPTAAGDGAKRYAELPGLRSSSAPWLQEEYARLRSEEALPLQLETASGRGAAVMPLINPAASGPITSAGSAELDRKALAAIYPTFSRQWLADQIAGIFPQHAMDMGPAELSKAHELLRLKNKERRQFADEFMRIEHLRIPYRDGLMTNVEIVDTAIVGCRLEIIHAATLLADGTPEAALDSVTIVRHVARLCSEEGHYAIRLGGAAIRRDLVQLIQALHNHPQSPQSLRRQILDMVVADAASWPDDSPLWIGDRAVGLHTYEVVRDGYFLSLLSEAEMTPLKQRNILNVTARTAMKNADADEAFYLQCMRHVIESCSQPFAERLAIALEVRSELKGQRDTPEYPLVAGMILLNELESGIRMQVTDRACWFALMQGLQHALNQPLDTNIVNPLTAAPFLVEEDEQWIRILPVPEDDSRTLTLKRIPAVTAPISVNNGAAE